MNKPSVDILVTSPEATPKKDFDEKRPAHRRTALWADAKMRLAIILTFANGVILGFLLGYQPFSTWFDRQDFWTRFLLTFAATAVTLTISSFLNRAIDSLKENNG